MGKARLDGWQGRYHSVAYWIAVWFGAGLLRPAPGTWGSLAGLGMVLGYGAFYEVDLAFLLMAILMVTVLGTVAINRVEALSGQHDAPEIVIDEVAGQWIALVPVFAMPETHWGPSSPTPLMAAFGVGFLLFRFFDIRKPWPIGWVDARVGGGFGVMADDLIAGLMAALVLYAMMQGGLL